MLLHLINQVLNRKLSAFKSATNHTKDASRKHSQRTKARYFDGIPFKPSKNLALQELPKILGYTKNHID